MSKPTDYRDADRFQQWIDEHKLHPSDDYDLRSAYDDGLEPDQRGHLPDTYKLPNHITYSDESQYSKYEGAPPAGKWLEGPDGWEFHASLQNIRNAGGPQRLQEYFNQYEPDSRLVFPKR